MGVSPHVLKCALNVIHVWMFMFKILICSRFCSRSELTKFSLCHDPPAFWVVAFIISDFCIIATMVLPFFSCCH